MRIALIHNAHEWGGAERYTLDVAAGMTARGHEIILLTPGDGVLAERAIAASVRVVPMDLGMQIGWHSVLGSLNEPLFALDLYANPARARLTATLRGLISEGPLDVLHAQHVKEKLWVTSLGQSIGVPVAWTVHAPLEPWMRRGIAGRVHLWARDKIAGLLAVNNATACDHVAFGYPADLTRVVYNGIPLDVYASGNRGSTRRSLEVEPGEVLVLLPARPYAEKGVGVLLDAIALMASNEHGSRIRVVVAGGSGHIEGFRRQAQSLGVSQKIVFLGHRDDMPDLLAAADIVTLPSFFEGLPYVLSEAMAAGRPTVASDVGGIAEMIVDGHTGVLIPSRDELALATALTQLVGDEELRQRMGDAGRLVAAQRFAMETMLDGTEEFFHRVATGTVGG